MYTTNTTTSLTHKAIQENYIKKMVNALGKQPIILVDDTDIIKPHGEKFEALGKIRDGSSEKNTIEKDYLVTEIVGLTANKKQPVSLFSHIHSSKEKSYKSTNKDIHFYYYQLAEGLPSTLAHARKGRQDWFRIRRSSLRQLN